MPDELAHDAEVGLTVFAVRWRFSGNVLLTDGASDEVWGAGGNDASDYAVTMPETTEGESGHYLGDFDTSANIGAGVYQVAVFIQAGGVPVNSDLRDARGQMHWDGTAELNPFTLNTQIEDDVIGADGDTLKSLSDQLDGLTSSSFKQTNKYGPKE